MTYIGTVSKKGTVTLPPDANLPEGTKVEVTPLPTSIAKEGATDKDPTLFEMFKDFVGVCEGPSDLARNHDHYAHGAPKR
jgi:hypothetical protein